MNAYIMTPNGVSGMIDMNPFNVNNSHQNFDAIIEALKHKEWDRVHDLINITNQIAQAIADTGGNEKGRIQICSAAGVILFDGIEIRNTLVDRIIKMLADGFDVKPMCAFLENCMDLRKEIADRIFDWIEAGCMPITEDGCFLAYKRVNADYTSFHDGKTMNPVGGWVRLPRSMCDDDQHNTCSAGLHFCSQGYLPSYHGGMGRILVLKINPKDVVAIPYEYGTAKGRACAYEVVTELSEAPRVAVENPETPALPQPVIETRDLTQAAAVRQSFVVGYENGFKAGKAKSSETTTHYLLHGDYNEGYRQGYKDGRGKKAKRFKMIDGQIAYANGK